MLKNKDVRAGCSYNRKKALQRGCLRSADRRIINLREKQSRRNEGDETGTTWDKHEKLRRKDRRIERSRIYFAREDAPAREKRVQALSTDWNGRINRTAFTIERFRIHLSICRIVVIYYGESVPRSKERYLLGILQILRSSDFSHFA